MIFIKFGKNIPFCNNLYSLILCNRYTKLEIMLICNWTVILYVDCRILFAVTFQVIEIRSDILLCGCKDFVLNSSYLPPN